MVNHGDASGRIRNRDVYVKIIWDNNIIGEYFGSANSSGKVRGETRSGGASANFNIKGNLPCMETL